MSRTLLSGRIPAKSNRPTPADPQRAAGCEVLIEIEGDSDAAVLDAFAGAMNVASYAAIAGIEIDVTHIADNARRRVRVRGRRP